MYGYVRPDKGELKIREYERFRAMYCGLCEALRERYGLPARFIVNYDLTFLAMVLAGDEKIEPRRCPVHPTAKRPVVCRSEALNAAADYSVILAWWKLRDSVADDAAAKAALSRAGSTALRRAYQKAASQRERFDRHTREGLAELSELEKEHCASLDRTADCFAGILASVSEETEDPDKRRIRKEIFYHVGRMVYILDAVDDLKDDVRDHTYNPLIYRFSLEGDELNEEQRREIRSTLNLSQRNAAAALQLRQEDPWQPILENIICLGLPRVTELVFSGQWNRKKTDGREPATIWKGEKTK